MFGRVGSFKQLCFKQWYELSERVPPCSWFMHSYVCYVCNQGGWNRCKLHSDVKLSVGLFVLVCHRHNILLWRGRQDKANCRCEWRAITGNDSSRSSFILCGFGPRVMHLRHLAEGVTKPISQVGRRGYKREHSCQMQSWEILWLGGFLTLAFFLQPG